MKMKRKQIYSFKNESTGQLERVKKVSFLFKKKGESKFNRKFYKKMSSDEEISVIAHVK